MSEQITIGGPGIDLDERDWPDHAIDDWREMQRDNAVYAAAMDDDLRRITNEQVEQFECSTALESAIQAWRMK